jgi:hypothetical protein
MVEVSVELTLTGSRKLLSFTVAAVVEPPTSEQPQHSQTG